MSGACFSNVWKAFQTWWGTTVTPKFLNDEDLLQKIWKEDRRRVDKVRMLLTGILIVVMVVWLALDISFPALDGLVPGTKDSFVTGFTPYNNAPGVNKADILNWHEKSADKGVSMAGKTGKTFTCACSYPYSGSIEGIVPETMLDFMVDNKSLLRNIWELCNTSIPIPQQDDFIQAVSTQFVFEVYLMRIVPSYTNWLLTKPAWDAARLSEANRLLREAGVRAKASVINRPLSWHFNETRKSNQSRVQFLNAISKHEELWLRQLVQLESAFAALLWRLFSANGSAHSPSQDVLNISIESPGKYHGYIQCNGQDAGWRLCESYTNTSCGDQSGAYKAYVDWCGPKLCMHQSPKGPYLKGMQIAAALGGLWGLFSLVLVLIGWNWIVLGVFCSGDAESLPQP